MVQTSYLQTALLWSELKDLEDHKQWSLLQDVREKLCCGLQITRNEVCCASIASRVVGRMLMGKRCISL